MGYRTLMVAAVLSLGTPVAAQRPVSLSSPDGSIRFDLVTGADGRVRYTVTRHGEPVIAPSPLGLIFTDRSQSDATSVVEVGRSHVDRLLPIVAGKAASARDRYDEMTVALRGQDAATAPVKLIVRAFDDGIAFRYVVAPGARPISIWQEKTGFYLTADDRCWGSLVGSITSSHESEFDPFSPALVRPYHLYDTGVLCRTPTGRTSILFTEADLDRYGGLYLRGRGDGGIGFDTLLSQRDGEMRTAATRPAGEPLATPWRLMLMADRAGDLIASNTIGNLNPQPTGDWRWVRPGKAAWDWWSGPYFPGQAKRPTNMADLKRLIDFAGSAGLEYMLIDEGWARNSGTGGSAPADTDITRSEPGIDMPALVAYAKARGVGLMLWVQWRHIDARMTEALDRYADWGIKGIKVDFMDRNDAEMVGFYHRIVAETAKRRLLVDLHGAYHPTGLARTMPNYITQEGVMGAEYNKWSRRVTATHNVRLAFTRLVLGPMDYTPGGFRNVTPAAFAIVDSPPEVQTTRGAALAMYVVYESPLQMVSDGPDAYAAQAEFGFVRDVPTTWDETRFLDGDIDSHVVVARRKGRDWYVGAMTDERARDIVLPLAFLGPGRFAAEIWQDGARAVDIVQSDRVVGANDRIRLHLSGSGGAAIHFRARE